MRALAEALLRRAGLPAAPLERLAQGHAGELWRAGDHVVKLAPGDAARAEAAGLRALAAAGARVPAVHHVDDDGLLLDFLPPGPEDWPALGRLVAALHAERTATYGADPPLYIATIPLPAGHAADWPRLYREQRIEPLLDGLAPARADRVRAWLDRQDLPTEGACLCHGDLWRGNVLFTPDGPALIDPSAQRAERGLDLAMIRLFGGFPEAFHRAYREALPVPDAVERSLPAYELYFLLVHVRLFGSGYHAALDQLVRG
ncbi:MAG: fructosamine kinase family protein [Myxococcota bacterium]